MKFSIRIAAILTLLIVLIAGSAWWWTQARQPVDPNNTTPKIFVISRGDSIRSIATQLKNEGLIRSPVAFFLTVKLKQVDQDIQAGDFRLNQSMDIDTLIDELTHGTLDIWVTSLEGWRVEEIAAELHKQVSIPEDNFVTLAKEGYMFPDTYLIPKDASAAAVVQIMSSVFDSKVTEEIRQGLTEQDLNLEQGIILASIVEREGRTETDRPVIAGILLNRLRNDWPLQVDATLQYALGYQEGEQSWWKKSLWLSDKEINSPYNTYKNIGLPPGPIANPGIAAIRAVAFPQDSAYWYYLHDPQGGVHYAETLEEHNSNISQYLGL